MSQSDKKEFLQPKGFSSLAKNVGIKDETLDLTVIYSEKRARAAAVFTRSRFPGAPVIVGREHIAGGFAQALVINSKNANVAMGQQGLDNAREMCRLVAAELEVGEGDVLPFSTGVIGRPLPMEKIRAGLKGIRRELEPNNLQLAARAIMTTDRWPKFTSRNVGNAVVAGIAKGAGMIEPNMATMLVYLMTDAELPEDALKPMLKRVVDKTFNAISIDTDTSTSDTVVLMANGLAGPVDAAAFESALLEVSEHLAREICRNGEGATKLIAVEVSRAKDDAQAKRVAKAIVNSPLVKTAVYGCDPNWGRIIAAIGKCFDDTDIEPAKTTIRFGEGKVFERGAPVDCDLEALRAYLAQSEVTIGVDLGIAKGAARVWGCDLTEEYIKENAYYTT
ncbi:MAG TPA: bifunctional glutamate N-acetyltransferase/amino-acid acetyltransferase ArgJ [Candidatus Binatia bacterium]|jgi:glutamate N-acetyltransferase/amino-acid N-acetyltransferase|nr:bifunctional glutamate N-acetyltransferase/amino-acid acetyltransferase ArgJ [Candidatus Binatia bacterium]